MHERRTLWLQFLLKQVFVKCKNCSTAPETHFASINTLCSSARNYKTFYTWSNELIYYDSLSSCYKSSLSRLKTVLLLLDISGCVYIWGADTTQINPHNKTVHHTRTQEVIQLKFCFTSASCTHIQTHTIRNPLVDSWEWHHSGLNFLFSFPHANTPFQMRKSKSISSEHMAVSGRIHSVQTLKWVAGSWRHESAASVRHNVGNG